MNALVGNFLQPVPDLSVGCNHVKMQTCLLELGGQRNVERPAQVAIEAFNLAFGARPIGAAEFDDKAAVFGVVEKAGVVTMLTWPIDITFDNDGLHVVVENASGHPAQGDKGFLVAVDQRTDFHVGDEFDVACPAVAERGAEGAAIGSCHLDSLGLKSPGGEPWRVSRAVVPPLVVPAGRFHRAPLWLSAAFAARIWALCRTPNDCVPYLPHNQLPPLCAVG